MSREDVTRRVTVKTRLHDGVGRDYDVSVGEEGEARCLLSYSDMISVDLKHRFYSTTSPISARDDTRRHLRSTFNLNPIQSSSSSSLQLLMKYNRLCESEIQSNQTMDRYQKVEKPRAEQPIDENEIRITSQGRMRSYITYAMTLLQEKGSSEIVFKAMGRAINKTVTIVELIKRRIVGLHQITSIGSIDITDTWEPLEEGLLPLETTRHVSMITITLSKEELNTSSIGYQPPLPADQVKVSAEFEYEGDGSPTARGRGHGGRGRGRSRAAPGNSYAPDEYDDGGWEGPGGYPRGRARCWRV
ncbi:hypothetical protein L1987_79061 [Smallanthus sonchifolius]|uniref:Uncharacterized protein n=1 Tax=Smallanthus sonchifolius TaxID=185202 RepID=A0ACB8ZDG3_9ASTR|nr:hypothetical protein L1987_79061 [Smallanthus sonchifolius]